MDYERIQTRTNHQGIAGVLSPRKLRNMLLGVEDKIVKKMKNQDQETVSYSLRSQVSQIGDLGNCLSEECKDVDVASVQPECRTSFAPNSYNVSEGKSGDSSIVKSAFKSQGNYYLDYDSGHDISMLSPMFEFHKADRVPKRGPLASFSRPAPSKWDDAQKWIASPNSNQTKPARKSSSFGFASRQPVTKVVLEVPDKTLVPFEEPDTKIINCSQTKTTKGGKVVGKEANTYPIPDSYGKEIVVLDDCIAEPTINLSRHESSAPIHIETTLDAPSSTARPVSMRDMGTEMTPMTSQEPSRNGTPVRSTTPTRSPVTCTQSTPERTVPASSRTGASDLNELSEKELQIKTRREIIALGTQLGKTSITAWASKEEEKNHASAEQSNKFLLEARATAWEEAEKAKYMARFKREEMKIQAWENHQKAKAEAEMTKTEAEVERMRARAQDRVMDKLAATTHKAEEKRAAAEAYRKKRVCKMVQQVEYIHTEEIVLTLNTQQRVAVYRTVDVVKCPLCEGPREDIIHLFFKYIVVWCSNHWGKNGYGNYMYKSLFDGRSLLLMEGEEYQSFRRQKVKCGLGCGSS